VRTDLVSVDTGGRLVTDISEPVRAFASAGGEPGGFVHVFLPHATAGLALIETGAGSEGDLDELLVRLLPRDDRYAHRHGSRGHGGDHLLPALLPPSLVLPVSEMTVQLGTWQSVVIVDPNRENNTRTVRLSFMPA
jgi:secondary thiamine-phosphate synthase enzyme